MSAHFRQSVRYCLCQVRSAAQNPSPSPQSIEQVQFLSLKSVSAGILFYIVSKAHLQGSRKPKFNYFSLLERFQSLHHHMQTPRLLLATPYEKSVFHPVKAVLLHREWTKD